jgi:hypothetical protein
MERRYMLGEQRDMERLVGLGPEGDKLDQAYEEYWRGVPRLKERQKHARSALEALEKDDLAALEALASKQPEALAEGAADATRNKEDRIAAQRAFIAELSASIKNAPAIPARAMIPSDVEQPADDHIRLAGQFDRMGDKVSRGFLRVLGETAVPIPASHSGRRELSCWLTDVDSGAGRLAARVLANRIWHHLIGCGIVRTVDNFGRTGEAPTHPELLDHLARELIASGWSIKSLVRQVVLSRTFGLSSQHDEAGHALDPENRLCWRAHRRRLDPESLRDAMLLAAGQLDLRRMNSTVWYLGDQATAVGDNKVRRRTDFPSRSVYLPVIRNDLPELFSVFDFADPHATTGMRPQTTVATQGLFLLNDNSVMDAAAATAGRLLAGDKTGESGASIDKMFELILGSRPTDEEHQRVRSFLGEVEQRLMAAGEPDARHRAWSLACQALLASSRFQILE